MAPANGSNKSRKASSTNAAQSQPVPKRSVVPALPLTYGKRQSVASTTSNNPATNVLELQASNAKSSNGTTVNTKALDTSLSQQVAEITLTDDAAANTIVATHMPDSGTVSEGHVAIHEPLSDSTTTPVNDDLAASGNTTVPKLSDETTDQANGKETVMASAERSELTKQAELNPKKHAERPSGKPIRQRPQPAMSPTRYHMPPAFQPGIRPNAHLGNGDLHRGPRPPMPNGHSHTHQAHPSTGSVHFGTFHDSQTSSPAPPHSGGLAAPPGMSISDSHPPYMGPGGFPPMIPYGNDVIPTFDQFGRPSMGYAPMDSYPPFRPNFGPSTPHSFHGSHSSNAEEGNVYSQYPRPPLRNGVPAPGEDLQQRNVPGRVYGQPEYPGTIPNQDFSRQVAQIRDNENDIVEYILKQFANPDVADCALELRYLDDRAPPVRIPGHRFIFHRSERLAALLRQQTLPPSPSDNLPQTLLLETDSKWIRSDSFYMAVQCLYAFPLLPYRPPRNSMDPTDFRDAGSSFEQLNFALSYAAAGQFLHWSPVIKRGCEVATQLLNWQTIERVLEFALETYVDSGLHESHKYREGSRILLDSVATFIVHNLPSNFEFDADVAEPVPYERLPILPAPLAADTASADSKATLPAHKSSPSVSFGKGRPSQKISGIQFGDLTSSESKPLPETETPKASRQAQPVSHSVLSRVLLNLPFTQLKMILESSGSGNVQGWANAESRYRIVKSAVELRESRRIRAVRAISEDTVTDASAILRNLCSPEPQDLGRWSVLGWQEELLPYGNPDGPTLGRKWTPLMTSHQENVHEYP